MLHGLHAHAAVGFGLFFGHAAQHRQTEPRRAAESTAARRPYRSAKTGSAHCRQSAVLRTPPGVRSSIVTTMRLGQTREMDAVADPIDGQQAPAALGEGNVKYARAEVLREDGLNARAVGIDGAADFEIRARRGRVGGHSSSKRGSRSRNEFTLLRAPRDARRRRQAHTSRRDGPAPVHLRFWRSEAALGIRAQPLQNFVAQLRNAARAERQDHVAGFHALRRSFRRRPRSSPHTRRRDGRTGACAPPALRRSRLRSASPTRHRYRARSTRSA